ncbi:universal stress protein [Flavivirga rizhaonensis]|uniref:Universal stress protein n=1 Tax=Flavivirga rizhaonensis TaxID=2559571 RepID=A0A4S1DV68_9FLAO|nr:universal stress protein [Flavivirga rizhaonensis]TGV01745.1 universal stress protein [Flavivirga rizhaonensis]
MKNNTNKYKILVLSDLKKSTNATLKSTVSLAKMINGSIEFFHVKKPSDVVEKESQLSAMRTINKGHFAIEKEIQDLITPISKDYGVNINYSFTYGNVKDEMRKYIKLNKPDIIVLGKRKSKPLNFMYGITNFILKEHDGVIMLADNDNVLEPNKDISLGLLNGVEESFNLEFIEDLINQTQKPLKSFKIGKSDSDTSTKTNKHINKKVIEYVFEASDNTTDNLSNYVSKNNINLLCVNREKKSTVKNENTSASDIKTFIGKLNVSFLVTGGQRLSVQ